MQQKKRNRNQAGRHVAAGTRKRIAEALREWRTNGAGTISQENLAIKIGRSLSCIRTWERGETDPRVTDVLDMEAVKPGLVKRLFGYTLRQ